MTQYTSSGAIINMAGSGVSATIPEGAFNQWISGAISYINVETTKNWSDNYSSLNGEVRALLDETAASIAAPHAVKYDMSGYSNRVEAETILDVLKDTVTRNIKVLKDKNTNQAFMEDA